MIFSSVDVHLKDCDGLKEEISLKTRSDLPASMQPKVVVLTSDYPRLVNAKVDRQALVKNYEIEMELVRTIEIGVYTCSSAACSYMH